MKKLLIMGTSGGSRELAEEARKCGIYTIATDDLPYEQSAIKHYTDDCWSLSVDDFDALAEKCRQEKIDGAVNGASEWINACTATLCERAGLPCVIRPELLTKITQKHTFKKLCKQYGVPVAKDYFVSDPPTQEELDAVRFPVVVKPVDRAGNVGLSFCHDRQELVKACEFARSVSHCEEVIVEQMLSGYEFVAFYAMADGEMSLLSLMLCASQPGYPSSCYFVNYSSTFHLDGYIRQVETPVRKMLKAEGCKDGVCMIQGFFHRADAHFYVTEMGYRLSGELFAKPLKTIPGFDSYRWLIEAALGVRHTGKDLPHFDLEKPRGYACSYILWSKTEGTVDRVEGMEEIAAMPGVSIHCIGKPGRTYRAFQYLMVITFCAADCEEMFAFIRRVNRTIRFRDQNGENPAIYFDDFDKIRETEKEAAAAEGE